jgi:Sulfotransferase domain
MTPRRIAMWSGPRNISTALMRSWENRPDTAVVDEPLYAHYLQRTGTPHPGADEIIRSQETDWRRVVDHLTNDDIPDGKTIYYQKHMTHHLLPEIGREWLNRLDNVFLLRDPREVVPSFIEKAGEPRLEDIGLPQQLELFEWVRRHSGRIPPVIDARDFLDNPEGMLRQLCDRLGVPFTPGMLSWPAGPRATDGVWAKHWYDAVWRSTGFQPYRPKRVEVPARLTDVLKRAEEIYQALYAHRMV